MSEMIKQHQGLGGESLQMLLKRRSVKVKDLQSPAPTSSELDSILTAAMRVPDHGKLSPWRLLVLDEAGQAALGELCAQRFAVLHANARDKQIEHERQRPQRAPLLIVVLFAPKKGKIPEWEQQLSTGAVCMNLLHAAHAMGYAGQWLTEWIAYDQDITQALCEEEGATIAGFIYLGTAVEAPEERKRPDRDEVVRFGFG